MEPRPPDVASPGPSPTASLHRERLGHGRPLVLVHGFTQTGRLWAPVAAALEHDHEVIVVDAPGHGGSAHIDADLTEGATLLGAVGGPATYVGYSMGGRLCLHLALARPDLVQRLVLVGATPGIADPDARAERRRADERLADHLEEVGVGEFLDEWLAQPLFAGLSEAAAGRQERARNTARGLATSLRRAGTGAQEPLWDRLSALEMPVLVVTGGDDLKFEAIGREMAQAIGTNAAVRTIPGAGHSAPFEQPERFVAAVTDWLGT